jgi:hypothetical protein
LNNWGRIYIRKPKFVLEKLDTVCKEDTPSDLDFRYFQHESERLTYEEGVSEDKKKYCNYSFRSRLKDRLIRIMKNDQFLDPNDLHEIWGIFTKIGGANQLGFGFIYDPLKIKTVNDDRTYGVSYISPINSYSSCQTISDYHLKRIYRSFIKKILLPLHTSKPFIEAAITQFYPASLKSKFKSVKDKVISEVVEFLSDTIAPRLATPNLVDKAITQYQNLDISLPEIDPNFAHWEQRPNFPFLTIKENITAKQYTLLDTHPYLPFTNSSLSSILGFNAYYSSAMQYGDVKVPEHSRFLGQVAFAMYNDLPSFLRSFIHELGHKIDPNIGEVNSHDFRPAYSELLQCLSSTNSISMLPAQNGESFSDFLTTAIIPRLYEKYPEEFDGKSQVEVAMESTYILCKYEDENINDEEYSFSDTNPHRGVHPEIRERVNGILGSSLYFREFMGCEPSQSSRSYQTCSFEGAE